MEEENECQVKYCTCCHRFKSIDKFIKDKNDPRGVGSYCKKCKVYKTRVNRQKNWASYLCSEAKRRARNTNRHYSLSKNFIIDLFEKQNGLCYWYNIPMICFGANFDPQLVTIDKLDTDGGYTQDNIVLACFAANMGRNVTSKERFREFSEMLKGNTNKQ